MFFQMLSDFTGSCAIERELTELSAAHDRDQFRAPACEENDGVVIVQTAGAGDHECFILERRASYWAILEAGMSAKKDASRQ